MIAPSREGLISPRLLRRFIVSQAVRTKRWEGFHPAGGALEFYDLGGDPFKQSDLARERPEIAERIREIIAEAHRLLPARRWPAAEANPNGRRFDVPR